MLGSTLFNLPSPEPDLHLSMHPALHYLLTNSTSGDEFSYDNCGIKQLSYDSAYDLLFPIQEYSSELSESDSGGGE